MSYFVWALLTCDGCRVTYPENGEPGEAAHLEATVLEGWQIDEGHDCYCPRCQVERLIESAALRD